MVHHELLLFRKFFVHLYFQHDWGRFPTNHYSILNDKLNLDKPAVVHDQLLFHNIFIHLHIQHNR